MMYSLKFESNWEYLLGSFWHAYRLKIFRTPVNSAPKKFQWHAEMNSGSFYTNDRNDFTIILKKNTISLKYRLFFFRHECPTDCSLFMQLEINLFFKKISQSSGYLLNWNEKIYNFFFFLFINITTA